MLNAGVEVNEALVQYQTAREKADYYDKQVASLQTAAKSTSLLMKHGNTTYLEVLTAQQTLLNAQLSQVANRFTEIQGVISKHPIKYTIKNGCISFQVKQPSMVVSPSFFIPFFPFVWQHL